MTEREIEKTTNPDDLEEVDIRSRRNRGAVISVRLTPEEAQRLAHMASKSGLSVSELARQSLLTTLYTPWRLAGFGVTSAPALIVGISSFSGGGVGELTWPDDVADQWRASREELVTG